MSTHIELPDLQNGYLDVVREVIDKGKTVSPRGLVTRELLDVTLVLEDTTNVLPVGVGAGVSVKIAAANAAQLVGGVFYPGILGRVLSSYESFDSDGVDREGYGPRCHDQLMGAILRLAEDPSSRAAIITLQPPSTAEADGGKNFPCTTSLQFILRSGILHMETSMRSNDVLRGLSTDVWVFTRLQRTVAWVLGVQPGTYHHHAASLHAYESDMERLQSLHAADRPGLSVDGFKPDFRREDSRARHAFRWSRAQTWARGALGYGSGGPATRPVNVDWYYDQLRPFWAAGEVEPVLCWACRKVRDVLGGRAAILRGRSTRCAECTRACEARKPRNTPEARRAVLMSLHHVDPDTWDTLIDEQDGVCAICKREPDTGRWGPAFVVDHDHSCCPGKFSCGKCVRGLLCNRCNPMLAMAQDSSTVLESAVEYLRSYGVRS